MIIECYECGGKVSTEAAACMSCGAPRRAIPPSGQLKVPNQSFQQSQPQTNYQNPKSALRQVSFGTAKYQVICPQCKGFYLVLGKSISSKESIKCPNKVCGWRVSTKDISFKPVEDELVVYNRIKDFFSYEGRISVKDYWLSVLITLPVILIAKMFAGPLYPLILFGMLHSLWIKRYHDHGMQSAWITIQAIASVTSMLMILLMPKVIYGGETYPLLGFFHGLALLSAIGTGIIIAFVPSKKGLNRYGPNTSNVEKLWI